MPRLICRMACVSYACHTLFHYDVSTYPLSIFPLCPDLYIVVPADAIYDMRCDAEEKVDDTCVFVAPDVQQLSGVLFFVCVYVYMSRVPSIISVNRLFARHEA